MVKIIMAGLVVGVVLLAGVVVADDSNKMKAAVSAAENWLAMVDEGKYADSWKNAAQYFRAVVKQGQWEKSLQGVRKPLGGMISRKVRSKSYRTSLPGAPDGEYVVIQFESSFENKRSAIETVTPMMDKDGEWRVAGYYIK